MKPIVSFKDVSLAFGRRPKEAFKLVDEGYTRAEILKKSGQTIAVAHATFDVEPGELLVVMGLSGSGKSTLLRCINGLNGRGRLIGTLRGSVTVNMPGEPACDVSRCGSRRLRRLRTQHISMVFQQFGLMPWRTVAENVALPLELQGIKRKQYEPLVKAQLATVGLEAWHNRFPHELSGGMQQRVGLARAFCANPSLLLMDEPFSALDPLIRRQLQEDLLALQRQMAKTIIFVSHDLEEAIKLGSRIAIMQEGRLLQCGTPAEIVGKPACDAVRQFIQHANPLNVLTAATLMQPLANLPEDASQLRIAPTTLPMRQVVTLLYESGKPILLTDHKDEVVGMITAQDALRVFLEERL